MAECASARDELSAPLAAYGARGAGPAGAAARPCQEYADSGYWQARFDEAEGVFDWYATYQELAGVFRDFCPPAAGLEVLMVGCGNSALSAELQQAGYQRIVNIDIAAAAVEKMEKHFQPLGLEWRVMDATAMGFEAESFNLAVDKGTADAMMHGAAATGAEVAAMSAEVFRVLRPGGVFLLVSHSASRQALLDDGVRQLRGTAASWECLELRQCRLSPQATLINILRSKLPGRPLAEAFRDPALLREAAAETKQALRQMAFIEAFRLFRARKVRSDAAAAAAMAVGGPAPLEATATAAAQPKPARAAASVDSDDGEDGDKGAAPVRDPRRQPFCWVYVLRKPREGAVAGAVT